MRVIVLRPRADQSIFVIVVVLITNVPIETAIQLNRQSCLGGLVTHWIRRDQCSWVSSRIRQQAALSNVLIDSIGRVEGQARMKPRDRIDKEEVVFHEVLATAKEMPHAVEKVLHYGIAVDSMVGVTSAERNVGRRSPVKSGTEHSRLYVNTEILQGHSGYLGRIGVVSGDHRQSERYLPAWKRKPALPTDICIVVITDTREHVVRRPMFGVEVECPIISRTSLKATQDCVSVVLFLKRVGAPDVRRCQRPIGAKIEAVKKLFNVAVSIAITNVHRVARIELVVTFNGVLILAIPCNPGGIKIIEANGVGSQARTRSSRD